LPPVCYEDGRQLRDYVNVADVARANVLALEATSSPHAVFNVGGGKGITVLEFAREMLAALSSGLEPQVPGMFRVGDTRHTVSDISALKALGWEPTKSVRDNVEQYLEWMSRFRDTRGYLEEAERVMREQGVVRAATIKV
jgi:dTDP-L-rhamnose 4-epimerase